MTAGEGTTVRQKVPRMRSALYVPGHRLDFMAKVYRTGADAVILDAPTARIFKTENYAVAPPFIFVEGLGSLESLTINRTQKDLLRAYYEIMTRQVGNEKLKTLTDQQVKEVINWEAEKHRKNMS